MTVMKEKVFTHSSLESGGHWRPCHAAQGHVGKHQDWSGGRRSKGITWAGAFIVVSVERNG